MKRRAFLGAGATALSAGLAGCFGLGGSSSAPVNHPGNLDTAFTANADLPTDEDYSDGFPPEYGNPGSMTVDESQFRALERNGETVKLVPTDVVRYWHQTGGARFVDARGLDQYRTSHIYGAVNSPAQRGSSGGGVSGWSKDDRILCYCGCPHHLSSVRAAGLQKSGYSNVYVFDEGFFAWRDSGLPMRGTSFADRQARVVEGEVAAAYAGEYAWAETVEGDQREAAPIAADGSFALHIRFADMRDDMPVRVTTPEFAVTQPLGDLTGGVLTA